MHRALMVADMIYNAALQACNEYGVEPALLPLVMSRATQRIEAFALSEMAAKLVETDAERGQEAQGNDKEVEDGGHISGD